MDISLNTFGTVLTKDKGLFLIIHKDGKQSLNPADIKSITIGKGAQITSDAALLAIENQIDVLFVDGKGTPLGRIWSVKYGSISTIRRKQLDFSFSGEAVEWIKDIVATKIENQLALLISVAPDAWAVNAAFEKTLVRLNDYKSKVLKSKGEIVNDIAPSLRGWEGAASKAYFETISTLLPENFRFESRSQHPATDIFNAMLNYGYGILYGKIEGALIKAGIDPYVGVLHRDDYNRPVLAFDIIELYRVWVDYVMVRLAQQEAVNEDCVSRRDDGSVWLEALGRRIVIQSMADYLGEIVSIKGLDRSRQTHIELYCQSLAQMFLKLKIV